MRKKVTLLLFMFIGFGITAQTLNVKGVVKDANGYELPGVSIIIKGTTTGTPISLIIYNKDMRSKEIYE